jgi:NAD(P)-dependent dehydrogenase (short-subunit alcohol dehydrogenase family)
VSADTGHELAPRGVTVVSLWPGLVLTERTSRVRDVGGLDFSRAESQRFTGRAVVALASDPDASRFAGQAVASRTLADEFGFTDVGGSLPDGPLHDRPTGIPDVRIG